MRLQRVQRAGEPLEKRGHRLPGLRHPGHGPGHGSGRCCRVAAAGAAVVAAAGAVRRWQPVMRRDRRRCMPSWQRATSPAVHGRAAPTPSSSHSGGSTGSPENGPGSPETSHIASRSSLCVGIVTASRSNMCSKCSTRACRSSCGREHCERLAFTGVDRAVESCDAARFGAERAVPRVIATALTEPERRSRTRARAPEAGACADLTAGGRKPSDVRDPRRPCRRAGPPRARPGRARRGRLDSPRWGRGARPGRTRPGRARPTAHEPVTRGPATLRSARLGSAALGSRPPCAGWRGRLTGALARCSG